MYHSLATAIQDAETRGLSLSAVALEAESLDNGRSVAEIRQVLGRALAVMRQADGPITFDSSRDAVEALN